MFLKFDKNIKGRDFCVGDIHGCFDRLLDFLNAIKFDVSCDRLFCTGDLCDKGPNSDQVFSWLEQNWFFPVAGNHEQMLIDACDPYNSSAEQTLLANGGEWFFCQSWDKQKELNFAFSSLPLMIEVDCGGRLFGIIHSDVVGNDWTKTREELVYDEYNTKKHIQWSRTRQHEELASVVKGVDFLLVGHTPVECVKILGNVVNLDTGAVFKGQLEEHSQGLTILNMNDFEFYKEVDYV